MVYTIMTVEKLVRSTGLPESVVRDHFTKGIAGEVFTIILPDGSETLGISSSDATEYMSAVLNDRLTTPILPYIKLSEMISLSKDLCQKHRPVDVFINNFIFEAIRLDDVNALKHVSNITNKIKTLESYKEFVDFIIPFIESDFTYTYKELLEMWSGS